MNVSNETQVSEEALVRILRATRANDAEAAPKRHRRQTDQCPSIVRFAAVLRRAGGSAEGWTAAESGHIRGCAFCQSLSRLFAAAAADATGELTVSGMSPNEDTQTGAPLPAKKSGTTAKPATRPPAE
jgi:hypothetical protein